MHVEAVLTGDGSYTAVHPEFGCLYHSDRGAVGEARHVYIENGLLYHMLLYGPTRLEILDMGFGTGLNAWMTLMSANIPILYHTIEKYPIPLSDCNVCRHSDSPLFKALLSAPWNETIPITDTFTITKTIDDILQTDLGHPDIVYWDAFAPDIQPELWSEEIFSRLHGAMSSNATLVTYSAKGTVKQALRSAGFTIQRLPGALGKHHMLRATAHH